MTIKPPSAKRVETQTTQLGRTRCDPYAWLRDENWQDIMHDPALLRADIRAYLEAENTYTQTQLETPMQSLRQTLFAEMQGRIKQDDEETPSLHGPYAYYRRYRHGGEHPIFARKNRQDAYNAEAPETLLLDGDALAANQAYFKFSTVAHSPDHRFIAWTQDTKGSEFYTLKVRHIERGTDLDLTIPNTYGDFVWAADSSGLYWIARNAHNRPEHIYWRGLDSGEDALVYREPDPGFFLSLDRTESGRFIMLRSGDHTCCEYRIIDTRNPDPTHSRLIAPRRADFLYELSEHNGRLIILTNYNNAQDFQIMTAAHDTKTPKDWQTLVPHQAGTLILDTLVFAKHLVWLERRDGLPRLRVRQWETGSEHTIHFDGAAYELSPLRGLEYETSLLRGVHASPAQPDTIFDYDMDTRQRVIRKIQSVPSGHDPDQYEVSRLFAPTRDGETVPISLLKHKDTLINGTAPVLLYGYGAYGHTIPADFRTARLSLVDRGFIYAIAHVRGGKAKGYHWYLDGKLDKKPNSFLDYVTAGRYLIEQNYSAAGRIVGMGGSAGGLLMGAAVNLDPSLFAGIIAAVPFVDVLNTMSDTQLPLTPPEWPEWGNPLQDAKAYDTIAAYSPYEQTSDKPYPPMLVTGGLTDPRVTYWEPAKWVAALRCHAPEAGPYFLRINMDAGHGGASGRFQRLHETAIEYAFALSVTGLAKA